MKHLCISHKVDLDGWCSAAIVTHYWKLRGIDNTRVIGWTYGDPIPEEEIKAADTVIMCDISFDNETMQWINKEKDLTWLDHHASAIKKVTGEFKGLRDTKLAACELTWYYLFPDEPIPEFVEYLGLYDSFRHKNTEIEQQVLEFQYGARGTWTCPMDFDGWFEMSKEDLNHQTMHVLVQGKGIYRYLKVDAQGHYAKSFPTKIAGYNFLVINKERFNPINFGIDYHKDGYDGFACFWYNGDDWIWSLYSSKIDVSKIAEQQGGGGHAGAAGFMQEELKIEI